ncbi:hypothetical protein [Burkholderia sp. TSV86]|uniref:hypothetical protein n=1 Tax=Burkholderia sp. TSV86 TaxID=1385594 RepID=UPI0012E33EBE|nr:hypothetical protein [Burkholderia sp. TSV86]
MRQPFFLTMLEAATRGLAPEARLAHPFLRERIEGADAVVRSLGHLEEALGDEASAYLEFRGDAAAAVAWRAGKPDRRIEGVTLALTNADGMIDDVRVAVRPLQWLGPWRDRLRRVMTAWNEERTLDPVGFAEPADSEPVPRRLPFPLSDEAVFHGPAFVRPVYGAAAVSHVLGHAGAVYGECEYGPALRNGAHFLRAFTSKRLPLEIVSIAHLDSDERIDEWTAFMQPWPSMVLFRDHLKRRLGDYLDASFYGDA